MLKNLQALCKYYSIDGTLTMFRPHRPKKELLADWVIKTALAENRLKKGQPVAEITAGNFGIALAEQCRKIGSKLYLVPLGIFNEKVTKKLSNFDNVSIVNAPECRNITALKNTLDEIISKTGSYSFKQFENTTQVAFYKQIIKDNLRGIFPDAVFEKIGTGATLQAIKEILERAGKKTRYFIATPSDRKIETRHLLFNATMTIQIYPKDVNEFHNNFDTVLKSTENLSNLDYAKLSLFCAIEWLKQNPKKTAFVFIGD